MKAHRVLWLVVLTVAACAQQQGTAGAARGFQISGRVVNAVSGQAVSGIEVSITPVDGRIPVRTITGVEGRFVFPALPTGKYGLSARGRGFPDQAYEQHEGFSTAIAAGPGLESEDLVFRIQPGARISGSIADEANEPVADAQVFLFKSGLTEGKQSTHRWAQERTDDRGHYSFRHLPEGNYFVVVTATPWYTQGTGSTFMREGPTQAGGEQYTTSEDRGLQVAYPITYYPGVTDQQEATPITAHAGEQVTADLQIRAVPAYRIRVRYSHAKHPEWVEVSQRVFDFSLSLSGSSTAGDVSTTNDIPAGHYVLKLRTDAERNTGRELEMDVTSDTEIDAASLQTAEVSITGTVQTLGEAKLPQKFLVGFANRETGDEFMGQVAPKGEFNFHHGLLSAGDYEIWLGNPGGWIVQSMSATGAKAFGRTLHFSGPGAVHVNVVLSKGAGQVHGIVLREKEPVAAAMVVLVPQDIEHNLSQVRRDQSDSDGTFTLPRVVPGNYTVVAIQAGWNLQWADANVLKPYLAQGTPLVIEGTRDYHITVKGQ